MQRNFHRSILVCALLGALVPLQDAARAQLRIVTYNTLDKPSTSTDDDLFKTIFSAIGTKSVNGIAKRADIIAVQEQTDLGSSTADRMANQLNLLYGLSSYTADLIGTGTDRVGIVYDSSTVDLLANTNVTTGGPRQAYRAQFRPVGYSSADSDFFLYSAHLKAGSSGSNAAIRNTETSTLNSNAIALGAGENVIFAGDLNIYDESDQAYLNLTSGAGIGNDPLALGSWPTSGGSQYLTQSTRTSNLPDGGASGGLDDRFDHQVISDSLLDGEGLTYLGPTSTGLSGLSHSYHAFGNDGVSYNQSINNTYSGRSQPASVIDALYNYSDHLPVVADYQLPASMLASLGSVPTTVPQGAVINFDVIVENIANVLAVNGADELDYSINVSGALSGSASGTDFALGGGNTHQLLLDTSTLGPQTGTVTVTTSSQAAANSVFNLPVNFTVGTGGGGPVFGVIAKDDFDSTLNRNSFSQSPAPGSFGNAADGFETYQVGVSDSIPYAIVDDSGGIFAADTQGIIDSGTKTDAWFGVADVDNPDNPSGMGVATWEFNITGATGIEVSIDMGAMGDFDAASDSFDWTYSIDGGAVQPLFTSSVDSVGSATYTLADGDMFTLDDPLQMTTSDSQTLELSNILQTLTSPLVGSGTTLVIELTAITNDDSGSTARSYAFDNIVIEGFTGGSFLAADFNEDGNVDALDLAQWQGDFGQNDESDADGDGDSDGADFLVWQSQNGQSTLPIVAAASVPEPSSLILVLLSLSWFIARRKMCVVF